jgi:hypothetical protein
MRSDARQEMQQPRKQNTAGASLQRTGFPYAARRWGGLLVSLVISACGMGAQTMPGTTPIRETPSTVAATPLYGAYIGFPVAWTPAQTLRQTGFQTDFGFRMDRLCFVGFEVSRFEGTAGLTLSQTPASLGNPLREEIAELEAVGILPPGYRFQLSGVVDDFLLGAGPQFTTRPHHRMMFFANPDLGAMRATLTPRPHDAFTRAFAAAAAPSGRKVDWAAFFGGAAGVDFQVGHKLGIRSLVDVVHSHPFNDLLANGVWSYRLSTGVSYQFGRRARSN